MPDEESGLPGGRLVRAIGPEGGSCPTSAQGANALQMNQRVPAVRTAFPIFAMRVRRQRGTDRRGCSAGKSGRAKRHCRARRRRLLDGLLANPAVLTDWPFAKVAESASREIVAGRSFVLRAGDFHYRENSRIESECGTSPFGDNHGISVFTAPHSH
jgi:hypothetical protein